MKKTHAKISDSVCNDRKDLNLFYVMAIQKIGFFVFQNLLSPKHS